MKNGFENIVIPEMKVEEMPEPRMEGVSVVYEPETLEKKGEKELVQMGMEIPEKEFPFPLPHAPNYTGLMDETFHRNVLGKNLLLRLYESAFKDFVLQTYLKVIKGEEWNEGEEAVYRVGIFNKTGFDLKNFTAYLEVVKGTGDATPRKSKVFFGDIPNCAGPLCRIKYFDFPLKAKPNGEGDVTLKLKFRGQIGDCKKFFEYDGTAWRWLPIISGGRWVKFIKDKFEEKYIIYPS
jgi:hypothetical protein